MAPLHAEEVETSETLVRGLLRLQFPDWAELPLQPVVSAGTDNALYRLGTELVVRLPRIHWAAAQSEKEQRWLPHLAAQLPIALPVVLARGAPALGYPWHWSVCRWLEGENATLECIADTQQFAGDLARFIRTLQSIDATGGPAVGAHNSFRGVPLGERDELTRGALDQSHGLIDVAAAKDAWNGVLELPRWAGPCVWVHGDLQSGNLLTRAGQLSAVIDFGCLGVGDPAVDLIVAWNLLPADARAAFRTALGVDAATWGRGRGWALSVSLIALPYYQHTNPMLAGIARHAIAAVLADPA